MDVPPDSPFYSYIQQLACAHVLGGYEDGTFRPNNPVSRGQVAKLISNAAGYDDAPAGETFADVPSDSPFYVYIERIASRNIVGGYECGRPSEPCDDQHRPYFRPGDNLSRGQIAKVIANVKGYNDPLPPDYRAFTDVPPNHTFWLYIHRVALHGVVSGYGLGHVCSIRCFRPQNDVTRGQTAKIVTNAFFAGDQSNGCGGQPYSTNDWFGVDRTCVTAGDEFKMAAGIFEPGEVVSVYLTGPDGKVYPVEIADDEETANSEGIVGPASVATDSSMPPGIWRVTAEGTASQHIIWTYFKLIPPGPISNPACQDIPPSEDMTVGPSNCAPAGTEFSFEGSGFQPGENVGMYVTAPDGSVIGAPFEIQADEEGNAGGVTLNTNSSFPQGIYTATMEGTDSNNTARGYFKLLAP
ncbi:MAG TPA: S-layer homology domain-containing protein [Chloroflexia bacterium]|nr:S-layer homology domain-containing protein [Chloroflexia bacterium]